MYCTVTIKQEEDDYMYKPDSRAEVPEPQCSIPRSRESKMPIAADHNI